MFRILRYLGFIVAATGFFLYAIGTDHNLKHALFNLRFDLGVAGLLIVIVARGFRRALLMME